MTNDEFRAVRSSLGLTQAQLARVLGYAARENVALLESAGDWTREIPSAIARLMTAYAAGYRPPDWPARPGRKLSGMQ